MAVSNSIDQTLHQFSLYLIPAENDLRDGEQVADKIFNILEKNKKFKIGRSSVLGSVAKKTALAVDYDINCVTFINDISVDYFSDVFQVFAQTLETEGSKFGIDYKIDKRFGQKLALQSVFVDGFECDIVPAINFNENYTIQRHYVMEKMKRLRYPSLGLYRLGSSLMHDHVDFITRQSLFVHDLIRLAKYWSMSFYIDEYVPGRSPMIEHIAVHAGNIEERESKAPSLYRAFRLFLGIMKDLKSANIIFDMFYNAKEIRAGLIYQRPLVLDATNPANNLAFDLFKRKSVLDKFQNFAGVSIQRLDSLSCGGQNCLFTLFDAQPSVRRLNIYVRDRNWVIEVKGSDGTSKRCRVIDRNNKGDCERVKIWKHYLLFNIKLIQNDAETKEEVINEVERIINSVDVRQNVLINGDNHVERDVTFEIPSNKWLIICSFNV